MSIGSNIKRLRREREITQEQLAEMLYLTPSAISQWETDRVLPDVSQIPLLAGIFRVSADIILGIELESTEGKLAELLEESGEMLQAGRFEECARLLEKAHHSYPNSHQVMVKLADALTNCLVRGLGAGEAEEILGLCGKVLQDCTDSALRNEAVSILCRIYRQTGQTDALLRTAEAMPHAWESREDLLMWNLRGEQARLEDMQYIQFCLSRLGICLEKLAEEESCPDNDRIRLYEQIISLFNTVYCDGDLFYYAQNVENAYRRLAEIHLAAGRKEQALEALTRCAEAAAHFDTYDETTAHTSPAVRGFVVGGWIMEAEGNRSAQLLDDLSTACWNLLRDEEAFAAVEEMLKKTAKKP